MNKKHILGIIPARGGSKGIPKKNIAKLNNKPLIAYTIEEAKKSKLLDNIFVSTEDPEIEKISKKFNVDVIKRPKKLSLDKTTTNEVIVDIIKRLEFKKKIFDAIVILQPTSPLRLTVDIDNSICLFLKNKCDSVMSLTKVNHPVDWIYRINKNKTLKKFTKSKFIINRRQDSPTYYQLNGAVLVGTKNFFLKQQTFGKNTIGYIMPPQRSIDIDDYYDLKMASLILKNKNYLK